mmetsp:Transcript_97219/g.261201  ORF Transcript_97219/g.261201 Transcript_97219/m.261201 type:complete len:199 (-) Transcript_97219:24-620(-)
MGGALLPGLPGRRAQAADGGALQRALEVAAVALRKLARAWQLIGVQVDEDPKMLRRLCCLAGMVMISHSCLMLLGVLITGPSPVAYYALQLARALFGAVTVVSELELGERSSGDIKNYQALIHEWAAGLKTFWGRGVFYVFQGLLTWASVDLPFTPSMPVGLYMMGAGALCFNLHLQRRPVPHVPAPPVGPAAARPGR